MTDARVQAEELRDPVAHRVEPGREPRPGGDDRQVDARRSPARAFDASADLLDQDRAGDAARGAGVGREQPSEVTQPGRPEQRVGDGVEHDVAVRVTGQGRGAGDLHAAQPQGLARPERMAVVADPRPDGASGAEGRGHPPEIARERHLEVAGIAGHDMDRDATGFEEGGLVGERLGSVGREPAVGLAQQVAAHALGRLRGAQAAPLDGRADQVAVDPLEGLGHRHDRDGRPVTSRRLARRPRRGRRRSAAGPRRGPARRPRRRLASRSRTTNPACDRFLAPLPARDHIDDGGRQPRRGGHLGAPVRRGDHDDPPDRRRRGQRAQRPREKRAARRSRPRACPRRPSGSSARRRRRWCPRRGPSRAPLNRAVAGRRSSGRRRSAGRG